MQWTNAQYMTTDSRYQRNHVTAQH